MELNAEHEFWTMIEELASRDGNIQQRAAYTTKRLSFLEPNDVPEAVRSEFTEIKRAAGGARGMNREEAQQFIMRILSLYSQLRNAN